MAVQFQRLEVEDLRQTWLIHRAGRPVGSIRLDLSNGDVVGFSLERVERRTETLRQTRQFLLDLGRWLGLPVRLDRLSDEGRPLQRSGQTDDVRDSSSPFFHSPVTT
jgi:hypothetical protein